ncbi:MAG: recombinase family protein [Melioribacteraceae bacterium]
MKPIEEKIGVGYTRVSDKGQEDGPSLEYQEKQIEDFCKRKKIKLTKVVSEQHSAKDFNRPKIENLINFAMDKKNNVKYIIVARYDRLGRNIRESLNISHKLKQKGIAILSVEQDFDTSNPESLLLEVLFMTLPEVDNRIRSHNIKKGNRGAQKRGVWIGPIPYGYEKYYVEKKRFLKPSKESKLLIFELFERVAGGEQVKPLRRELIKKGFPLSKTQTYRALSNIAYLGKIPIREWEEMGESAKVVEGVHKAIIDEPLFLKVQKRLGLKKSNVIMVDRFPLKGMLQCSLCGRLLTASISKGNGGKYTYYHCQRGCKERIRSTKIEEKLIDIFNKIKIKPEIISLFHEVLKEITNRTETEKVSSLSKLEDQLNGVEDNIRTIGHQRYLNPTDPMDKETFELLKNDLEKSRSALIIKIDDLKKKKTDLLKEIVLKETILNNLTKYYKMGDVQMKRKLISSIVDGKIVFEKNDFRTIKLNSVLELISSKTNPFSTIKNERAHLIVSPSGWVHPGGLEPPTN